MLKIIRSKETSQTAVVTGQSEIKRDNVNSIRCEARRHFRNKKREYMKYKINELAMNSKNKKIRDLYRGINEPGSELVKDENGDLLADSHNTLNRWKKYSVTECTEGQ
jgi:hypothetical protein